MLAWFSCDLLSEELTVVKCTCECNQSWCGVVSDPESVAMSTLFCAWMSFSSVIPILLLQQSCITKVIPWQLPRTPLRNCGNSLRANCIELESIVFIEALSRDITERQIGLT